MKNDWQNPEKKMKDNNARNIKVKKKKTGVKRQQPQEKKNNKSKQDEAIHIDGLKMVDLDLIQKIVDPPIRLKIFLSLYLYPELYVSQISRLLNINKNTASRHLRKMKKDGILKTRRQKTEHTIDKKFYRLTDEYLFEISKYRKLLDFNHPILRMFKTKGQDQNEKPAKNKAHEEIKLFAMKKFYNLVRALVSLSRHQFKLFQSALDSIEHKIDDIEYMEKNFSTYFQPPRKIDFYPVFISEKYLDEANDLFQEYTEKLREIKEKSDQEEQEKSIMFLNTILPIKDLLEKF